MKTSKVKNVQGNGTYENANGVDLGGGKKGFYKFDYEFEDGTFLSASHKATPSPFKIGDEVEYNVKGENGNGKYGSVSKPKDTNFQSGFKGKDKNQTASFALSYAKDLVIADKVDIEKILPIATKLNDWLKTNS